MPVTVLVQELARAIGDMAGSERFVLALAGPPAAGKSQTAEDLEAALNDAVGPAAILPMDGFHYDDSVLEARGLRPVKGAPETFDVAGLAHCLGRLSRNDEPEVAVPVFDRSIEISRASARIIPQSVRFVIVEGNYLLFDTPPWSDLARHYGATVFVSAPESLIRTRLEQRWQKMGLPEEEITRKVEQNDLPNAHLVLSQSKDADYIIKTG